MSRVYCISYGQNATPIHEGFFASLKSFCKHRKAELIVFKGRYKNPTSLWTVKDESDQWWAPEIEPFLLERQRKICSNLCLYGDIHIRPTAKRPLTGWEVTVGMNSSIMGHTKHAFRTVPTASRVPRLLMTTGACTIANYTDSNAGKHGQAHHIIGALVVEVDDDGTYFPRQINAEKSGCFIDMEYRYSPEGVTLADPIEALTMGDIHVGQEDQHVLDATKALTDLLKPKHLILHDVLDFRSRNHHDKGLKKNYEKHVLGVESVEKELIAATKSICEMSKWADKTIVVRSNHDAAFDRYLEEADPHKDTVNARYYFAVWHRLFEEHAVTGHWPDAFEMEARRLGIPSTVRFLSRNEDFTIKGVSYGFHGDVGVSGSRGSSSQFAKLGVKTVTAHTHAPVIEDGNFTAGVSAKLDQDYNNLPSAWLQAHVIQYSNGKRAIIVIINGRFRGQQHG